jgi:Spy/CpxP family protein refolding chaperone
MKNYIRIIASAVFFGSLVLLAPTSPGQSKAAKLEEIAQYLNLTPEQKAKILPILAGEVPKVKAIKNDRSFSRIQKMQRIKAIHQQNDPQMKAILSPEQYQKLQAMRHKTLADAIH